MRLNEARLRKIVREELATRGGMQMHEGLFDKIFGGKKEPAKEAEPAKKEEPQVSPAVLLDKIKKQKGITGVPALIDQWISLVTKNMNENMLSGIKNECQRYLDYSMTRGTERANKGSSYISNEALSLIKDKAASSPGAQLYFGALLYAVTEAEIQYSLRQKPFTEKKDEFNLILQNFYEIIQGPLKVYIKSALKNLAALEEESKLSVINATCEQLASLTNDDISKFYETESFNKKYRSPSPSATKAESFRRGPNDVVLVERWQRLAGLLK